MKRKLLMFVYCILPIGLSSHSAEAHFTASCKKNVCKRHVIKPFVSHLLSIASCESGRRWYLNIGLFDGGFQFSPSTWRATGSKYSFAYQAPPIEQKYRAVVWASKINWSWHSTAGWPVCG